MNEFFAAFWAHIFECLKAGDVETRLWLDTDDTVGGFLWWCETSDHDPEEWRTRLLKLWEMGPSLSMTPLNSSASDSSCLPWARRITRRPHEFTPR